MCNILLLNINAEIDPHYTHGIRLVAGQVYTGTDRNVMRNMCQFQTDINTACKDQSVGRCTETLLYRRITVDEKYTVRFGLC